MMMAQTVTVVAGPRIIEGSLVWGMHGCGCHLTVYEAGPVSNQCRESAKLKGLQDKACSVFVGRKEAGMGEPHIVLCMPERGTPTRHPIELLSS